MNFPAGSRPPGVYTISYNSGGPPNSIFMGISPNPAQELEVGRVITFTLEFASEKPPPPPQYSVTDIGNLQGSASSGGAVITGFNDAGELVGWAGVGSSGSPHGFMWTMNTGFVDLLNSIGAFSVDGINAAGQIIADGAIQNLGSYTFLYADHVSKTLPLSTVRSINNLSQIAGSVGGFGPSTHLPIAVIYTSPTVTQLDVCANCYSEAFAINDAGQVAGNATDSSTLFHRCFFYDGGKVTDLGTPKGTNSFVSGINNSGQVIMTVSGAVSHAFVWSIGTGLIDLGALSGVNASQGLGINNHGQVVGLSYTLQYGETAFIWTRNSGMVDLNTLISDPTWHLSRAWAINDNGVIAGIGTHNGQTTTFLLAPQPSVIEVAP